MSLLSFALVGLLLICPSTPSYGAASASTSTPSKVSPRILFWNIYMQTPQIGWAWGEDDDPGMDSVYLLRTQDGGTNWQNVTPGDFSFSRPGGSGFYFFPLNGSYAWIFQDGSLWRTRNGGRSWTETRTSFFGDHPDLLSVIAYFLSPDHGWVLAVNNHGMSDYFVSSYRTLDGGASWQPFPIGGDKDNLGLVFDAQEEGWSLFKSWLDGSLHIYRTQNGKVSEVNFPAPGSPCSFVLEGLKAFGPGSMMVLIACTGGVKYPSVQIYHTDDSGKTWHVTATSSAMKPFPDEDTPIVTMLNANVGWAAAVEGHIPFLYQTLDGGQTWTKLAQLSGFAGRFDFIDAHTGWAIDNKGNLQFTTDGGRTWTPLNLHIMLLTEEAQPRNK